MEQLPRHSQADVERPFVGKITFMAKIITRDVTSVYGSNQRAKQHSLHLKSPGSPGLTEGGTTDQEND